MIHSRRRGVPRVAPLLVMLFLAAMIFGSASSGRDHGGVGGPRNNPLQYAPIDVSSILADLPQPPRVNPGEAPAPTSSAASSQPTLSNHVVASGDTLWDLAVRYRTTIETIARLNNLVNTNSLQVGQNLLIMQDAAGTVHRVRSGDTLWEISRLYRVSVEVIAQVNNLTASSTLSVGQQLMIPTGAAASPMETTAARSGSVGFVWPVRGRITSGFGMRWGRMHEGVDIAASHGHPVLAARDGRVTFAGARGSYGNLIIISHGAGVETYYAHLSVMEVRVGNVVSAGQRIGRVGSTGNSTGPHLHFEIRINGRPADPRSHLP